MLKSKFLKQFTIPPSSFVDDDGSVEYDWIFDKKCVFSLTIYPDNKVGYAYLIGDISGSGVSYLEDGNLPDFILNKLQETFTQSERIK
jgi:hypothetical protein